MVPRDAVPLYVVRPRRTALRLCVAFTGAALLGAIGSFFLVRLMQ